MKSKMLMLIEYPGLVIHSISAKRVKTEMTNDGEQLFIKFI